MENCPFIDGLPIKNGDFPWQTVSHNQMVHSPEIFASIDPEDFAKCEWKKNVGKLPRFPSRHWRQEESRYPQYLSRGAFFLVPLIFPLI